jgi:hypothetical protein
VLKSNTHPMHQTTYHPKKSSTSCTKQNSSQDWRSTSDDMDSVMWRKAILLFGGCIGSMSWIPGDLTVAKHEVFLPGSDVLESCSKFVSSMAECMFQLLTRCLTSPVCSRLCLHDTNWCYCAGDELCGRRCDS